MRALTSYILQSDLTDGRSGVEVSVFQQIIVISTALVGSKKRTPALKRAMSLDHSKLRALSWFRGVYHLSGFSPVVIACEFTLQQLKLNKQTVGISSPYLQELNT